MIELIPFVFLNKETFIGFIRLTSEKDMKNVVNFLALYEMHIYNRISTDTSKNVLILVTSLMVKCIRHVVDDNNDVPCDYCTLVVDVTQNGDVCIPELE